MAEEANATAVKEEPAVQPAAPAPAPEETTEVADTTKDTGEYSSEDVKEESKDKSEDTSNAEDPKSDQPRGAEKRKQQLQGEVDDLKKELSIDPNTEIRDLVSARTALKQVVKERNAQVYRPATEQQLLDEINPDTGEYYTPVEAKVKIMGDNQQLTQYTEQVADTQLMLTTDASRAVRDFPMFDSESPEYNPVIAQQVDQILGSSLQFDPNTRQIIGSTVSPYQLYKAFHDTYAQSVTTGQLQGQRSTEQMLANADNVGGAPQAETPFENLSTTQMRERLRAKGHDV